jgi:hypothetical protein
MNTSYNPNFCKDYPSEWFDNRFIFVHIAVTVNSKLSDDEKKFGLRCIDNPSDIKIFPLEQCKVDDLLFKRIRETSTGEIQDLLNYQKKKYKSRERHKWLKRFEDYCSDDYNFTHTAINPPIFFKHKQYVCKSWISKQWGIWFNKPENIWKIIVFFLTISVTICVAILGRDLEVVLKNLPQQKEQTK